jgi:hypothetical protein
MLPHQLSVVLNFLGFPWPEIDEDQIREAAGELRGYARNISASVGDTDRRVTVELAHSYTAASYRALAEAWASQSRGHMDTLVEGCGFLAGALDATADGVEAMKLAVIAQLEVAAAEFVADQAAAVATVGLAEAALPALYAAQNRILAGIMNTFETEVIDHLVHSVITPLKARIGEAVDQLVYGELAHIAGVEPGLRVDTEAMHAQAAALHAEADAHADAGRALLGQFSAMTFGAG